MHDISNIQTVNPLALVEVSKHIFHVGVAAVVEVWPWRHGCVEAWTLARLGVVSGRDIAPPVGRNSSPAALGKLDRPGDVDTSFVEISVVFNRHFFLHFYNDGQKLHRGLLKERKSLVTDDADVAHVRRRSRVTARPFSSQLLNIEFALVFALIE